MLRTSKFGQSGKIMDKKLIYDVFKSTKSQISLVQDQAASVSYIKEKYIPQS